jgi:hypothetical protein
MSGSGLQDTGSLSMNLLIVDTLAASEIIVPVRVVTGAKPARGRKRGAVSRQRYFFSCCHSHSSSFLQRAACLHTPCLASPLKERSHHRLRTNENIFPQGHRGASSCARSPSVPQYASVHPAPCLEEMDRALFLGFVFFWNRTPNLQLDCGM